MSWIDIFLADGDPDKIFGATAQQALSTTFKWKDIITLQFRYMRAGFAFKTRLVFLILDILRKISYAKGFKDGKNFPWPEEG